jgi:hypothetical protein
MNTPFDSYTLEKARGRIPVIEGYADNLALYTGDHWGGKNDNGVVGRFWIGPRPQPGEPDAQIALSEIYRAFISKNAIEEVVSRHVGGVIGQEPQWKLTVRRALGKVTEVQDDGTMKEVDEQPTAAEQVLIGEAEAALTSWWDERGAHGELKRATVAVLLAHRGLLRLFVPPGLLVNGQVPRADLTTSLNRIYLHAPDPTQATVTTDAATQQQAGIYVYADADDDVAAGERKRTTERAELVYLDDLGRTVIRILGGEQEDAAAPLDLGGHLTIYELERDALITPQVRQLQALLNMALTMLGRNAVQAGFVERILLNVQLPGEYVGEGNERRFVPDPLAVGAATTNSFIGASFRDEQGVTHVLSPSVVYRDPVPVDSFVDTKREAYTSILEETDQLHALISGDATASGESRKQARAGFEASLRDTQAELNQAGRWLLETVLAMGAAFSGQPGRFAELRAVFECRLDTGPISSEEMRLAQELAGGEPLWSIETAQAHTKIADVDAENAKLAEERDARMARSAKMIQAQPQQPTEVGAAATNGNGQGRAVPA